MMPKTSLWRLKIDAYLARGDALYALVLETTSIVAVLYELSRLLAVTLSESFLDEAEYAAALIQVLGPLSSTTRVLPPNSPWQSHVTLRVRSEQRFIEQTTDVETAVLITLSVNDLGREGDASPVVSQRSRRSACDEEASTIRALDGFEADATTLLERLTAYMKDGAGLARRHLVSATAHRAEIALRSVYCEDPLVLQRIEQFAAWLSRVQMHGGSVGESSSTADVSTSSSARRH